MSDLGNMNALINQLSDEPFKFGRSDCYTFTAKLVKAWHGKDYVKTHACYKNEKEAKDYMARFKGIEALTIGTIGYGVHPVNCRDGDVATAEVAPGEVALGFVFGGKAFFKGKKKIFKLPLDKCRMGWNIR